MPEHPTPWQGKLNRGDLGGYNILDADGKIVCGFGTSKDQRAVADRIVATVNAHEPLREMLHRAMVSRYVEGSGMDDDIAEVLEATEGKPPTIQETLDRAHAAGGDAWDKIPPEEGKT